MLFTRHYDNFAILFDLNAGDSHTRRTRSLEGAGEVGLTKHARAARQVKSSFPITLDSFNHRLPIVTPNEWLINPNEWLN
jgi:hypothetical protein